MPIRGKTTTKKKKTRKKATKKKSSTRKKSTRKKTPAKAKSRAEIRRRQRSLTGTKLRKTEKEARKTGTTTMQKLQSAAGRRKANKQVAGRVRSTKKTPNARGLKRRMTKGRLGRLGVIGAGVTAAALAGKGVLDTIKQSAEMRKKKVKAKEKNKNTMGKIRRMDEERIMGIKKDISKAKKSVSKRKVKLGPKAEVKKPMKKSAVKTKVYGKKSSAKKPMKKSSVKTKVYGKKATSKVSSSKSKSAKLKMFKWRTKMGTGKVGKYRKPIDKKLTKRDKLESKTNAMARRQLEKLRMRLDTKNLKDILDSLDKQSK